MHVVTPVCTNIKCWPCMWCYVQHIQLRLTLHVQDMHLTHLHPSFSSPASLSSTNCTHLTLLLCLTTFFMHRFCYFAT